MNNKLRHTTIFEGVVRGVLLTFKINKSNSVFSGLDFVISIGCVQLKTTVSDYIGLKTTLGGKQISLSMIQIPLFHMFISICYAQRQHMTLHGLGVMQQNIFIEV